LDGSVLKWEVVKEEEKCRVDLRWGATHGALVVTGASMHSARGLSKPNKQLMRQRGAIGEPESALYEAGKKVATMVSVISRLKQRP
jgi:hypothetical protein